MRGGKGERKRGGFDAHIPYSTVGYTGDLNKKLSFNLRIHHLVDIFSLISIYLWNDIIWIAGKFSKLLEPPFSAYALSLIIHAL